MSTEYEIIEAARWREDWPDAWYDAQHSVESDDDWGPLLELRSRLAGAASAAKTARDEIDKLIAGALGDGGSIHDGQTFYRSSTDTRLKVIDERGLLGWLADDAGLAFNVNSVRISSVRMIAEGRGENPAAVEQTFFDRSADGELKLNARPLNHKTVPKNASKMSPLTQKGGSQND